MPNIKANIKESEWTCVKWTYICKDNDQTKYPFIFAVISVFMKDFLLAVSEMGCCMVLIAKFHIACRYMWTASSMWLALYGHAWIVPLLSRITEPLNWWKYVGPAVCASLELSMGLTQTEKTVSSKIQKQSDSRVHRNWFSDFTTNRNLTSKWMGWCRNKYEVLGSCVVKI
jgi:hypothetical protein